MKKNNNHIVYITILVCLMSILFTATIIVLDNYTYANLKKKVVWLKNEVSTKVDDIETQIKTEEDVDSGVIYISDKIDLSIDDTATHNVVFENSYTDTVELLPSIFYEHRPVKKEDISTEQFLISYTGIETANIIFGGETKVSFPTEIILYNVEYEASNSYVIKVDVEDEASYIKSFGWSTEDSSKITLSKTSGSETVVSVVGEFTGETTIRLVITYDAGNGLTATESKDIYIRVEDMVGDEIPLCDREGNSLYLDPKGQTVACLSDYVKQDVFYGTKQITGWQSIDGKTYYYNKDNVPVEGEQIIAGTKYIFDESGVLVFGEEIKGIDVSLYQKEIDWKLVAASGIDFAIIRCGFRGAVTARLVEDAYFRKNIEGAKAAGLRVGVYFFTQAISEVEAREEADMVLSLCKEYQLDLPIFIDTEGFRNARANNLDKDTRTDVIKAFCERISTAGMEAGIYASKYWFYNNLHAEELEQYCIWVAQYNTECDYKGKADYWQYTSTGEVSGITGNVDLNVILP